MITRIDGCGRVILNFFNTEEEANTAAVLADEHEIYVSRITYAEMTQ